MHIHIYIHQHPTPISPLLLMRPRKREWRVGGEVPFQLFFEVRVSVRVSVVARGLVPGSVVCYSPAVRAFPSCWFICYIMSTIYAPIDLGHSC